MNPAAHPVQVIEGGGPLILGMPHSATDLPPTVWNRLNDNGRQLRDTDWWIHRLYQGLLEDATVVRATFHRYAIDANRDPSGQSLYPGQATTGLIPKTDFDGESLWQPGQTPNEDDIKTWLHQLHRPYHRALATQIERLRARHQVVILFDCHSIRSGIPRLFEGTLPDLNLGTDHGKTCHPQIQEAAWEVCRSATGYTSVLNGRFRGGWTTRHYGRPQGGVHSVQLELAQSTYLAGEVPPFAYDVAKAEALRAHLKILLERLGDLALDGL